MQNRQKTKSWLGMNTSVRREANKGVYSAEYTLKKLVHDELINTDQLIYFQKKTSLGDFYWRAYWRRGDVVKAGGREKLLQKVGAVVIFLHGWDGCGEIWEKLPARVLNEEPNILVLVPDVNGFFRSPFNNPDKLAFKHCTPVASMRAVEQWLKIIGILGGRRHVPIVLVGHSMSGAALFYFSEISWKQHPLGRVALAPALLMNDLLRKSFYRTLGFGIFASQKLSLEQLTNSLSPIVINQLITGASKVVQATHHKVFKHTTKKTLAFSFYAMGKAKLPPRNKGWKKFKVILGNNDRLVGLTPMLDLLAGLGFGSRQVRAVFGDHYFFSVGQNSRKHHHEGREIALEEICKMVATCRR
jgi:pimeloyl-ACP methyl ester carboxylesterase